MVSSNYDRSLYEFSVKRNLSLAYCKRPQFLMVQYRLINHAGCWKNSRRIRKSRVAGERFTNFSSVLSTYSKWFISRYK